LKRKIYRRGKVKYSEQIKRYIYNPDTKKSIIEFLSSLVSVRSVMGECTESAPFGEKTAEVLEKALETCRQYGFHVENVENYVGTADINELEPSLAILCHLDVVPEGEGWHTDPYSAFYDEKSGRIYGRGTADDKGPAAAAMFAMRVIKELNIPLKTGVRLIFGTNEENGSADLKFYMSKRKMPPMVFTPDADYPVINIEKGMIRLDISGSFSSENGAVKYIHGGSIINAVAGTSQAEICGISAETVNKYAGNIDGIRFEIEQNGDDCVRITSYGVQAHASAPEKGKNAITGLIELIASLPLPECEQTDAIRKFAAYYPYGETDGKSFGIDVDGGKYGSTTLVLSVFDMDSRGFSAKNDIRFPVGSNGKEIYSRIEKELSYRTSLLMYEEPHCTDENSEFVQKLLAVYEDVTGDKGRCMTTGGGTYVHNIEGGVAFGSQFPGENLNMHGADEYITLDGLLKNVEIMANAIAEICGE
jgi:succinyl-diaminopimelate desuccinylase